MPYGGTGRAISLFELWGDKNQYSQWLRGENTDDAADFHLHTLKALKVAMEEELSPLQREYIERFFFQGVDMKSIGEELGVDQSTVSRTINRGLDKLYHVLRYANPRYLTFPKERIPGKRLRNGRKNARKVVEGSS